MGESASIVDAEHIVIEDMMREYSQAILRNDPFNSAHEGYAVILEELDELWEEVRKKRSQRSCAAMYKEAIQIATMGVRFAIDVCMDDYGRIK